MKVRKHTDRYVEADAAIQWPYADLIEWISVMIAMISDVLRWNYNVNIITASGLFVLVIVNNSWNESDNRDHRINVEKR